MIDSTSATSRATLDDPARMGSEFEPSLLAISRGLAESAEQTPEKRRIPQQLLAAAPLASPARQSRQQTDVHVQRKHPVNYGSRLREFGSRHRNRSSRGHRSTEPARRAIGSSSRRARCPLVDMRGQVHSSLGPPRRDRRCTLLPNAGRDSCARYSSVQNTAGGLSFVQPGAGREEEHEDGNRAVSNHRRHLRSL